MYVLFLCAASPPSALPLSMASHTSRVSIDVLLEPPEHYKNMNKEQNVSLPLGAPLRQAAHIPGLLALGAIVQPNPVRYASGKVTNDKVVLDETLNAAAVAAQQALPTYRVPIMLHNDEAAIVLTATSATGERLWSARFPYSIRAVGLAAGKVASTWKVVKAAASAGQGDHIHCAMKMPQVAAEPQLEVGKLVTIELTPVDGMVLALSLQMVVNKNTKEPLTFFVDRWWSLAKIALIAP
jgi:hypothetical protein